MIIWLFPVIYKLLSPVHDFLFHSEQGRRRVWKSERGGGAVVIWWVYSAPLVGIGLTDLPKFVGVQCFHLYPRLRGACSHQWFSKFWLYLVTFSFFILSFFFFFTFSLSIVVLLKSKMCSGDIADFLKLQSKLELYLHTYFLSSLKQDRRKFTQHKYHVQYVQLNTLTHNGWEIQPCLARSKWNMGEILPFLN